jgi:glucose-6-phosphate 1-dehydrogenase
VTGIMENHADLLVIFGITGDLARRMTFRALYRLERRGLLDGSIIGVASEDMTTGELVKHAREAIGEGG